jgi:hypothetical protein
MKVMSRFSYKRGPAILSVIAFIGMILGLAWFGNPSWGDRIKNIIPAFPDKDQYIWDVRVSSYAIDGMTGTFIQGGEDENWMKDEKGEPVAFWDGSSGAGWGRGSQVVGGSKGGRDAPTPLPHAVRLSYYDYGDEKFYRLDTVLPTDTIRQLMSRKMFTGLGDKPGLVQRYDTIEYSIGPKGYIVFWVSSLRGLGGDQVELGRYWAKERPGLTIAKWNANGGNPNGRGFPLIERWAYFKHAIEPGAPAIARLKAGWTPDPDYYVHAEIKYPWLLTMTGNATLMGYRIDMVNGEVSRIYPWELPGTVANPVWQAVPTGAYVYFTDRNGAWHYLNFDFFSQDRFGGHRSNEPDISAIANAFREIFPDITPDTRQDTVPKSGFARIEVNLSDDLKEFTVYLVKGDKRMELPVGQDTIEFKDVAPYTNLLHYDPSPAEVEWSKYGPR